MIWIILLLRLAAAHIRLTHPPARYPALDFIDNARTQPPCGVPRTPNGTMTWLRSGEEVNITWFQSVPHQGKLKLELLNDLDQLVTVLSPIATSGAENPALKTSATIVLPENYECLNCVIRVIRQATEFGENYFFYSCADVNIVKDIPDGDTCLGGGLRKHGRCECNALASGSNCQFQDECSKDADCGSHGRCISFSDEASPRKQCFCERGYFGKACEHASQSFTDDSEFIPSLYQMREVGEDKDKIYWRILKNEIEFVLKFKTDSWVGVGWKPKNSDEFCPSLRDYPSQQDVAKDTVLTTSSWWTSTIEKQIETVSNEILPVLPSVTVDDIEPSRSHHNLTIQKICGENEEYTNCPEFTRQCEASCDWTKFPETIPNCPRSCGTPKCVCMEGFVRAANDNDTCVPFHFCSDEVEMECPSNSTWAKCGIACEPTCENMYDTSPCPANCDEPACTCSDNYVRYKDTCIFWGDCPNLEERFASDLSTSASSKTAAAAAVAAGATSGKSLPALVLTSTDGSTTNSTGGQPGPTTTAAATTTEAVVDRLTCGINETINECGRACEPSCSNIYSRDKCTQCHKPACACIQGYARTDDRCVYWGECPRESRRGSHLRLHAVPSASTPSATTTARTVIVEYNGTTAIVLSQAENSASEIRESNLTDAKVAKALADDVIPGLQNVSSPTATSPQESDDDASEVIGDVCYGDWRWPPGCRDCDYRISWNYLDDSDEIEFSIATRAPSNWWTGVGFSPTGTMVEADMIIVKSQNGDLSLHDMYSNAYGVPREDSKQDVYTPTVVGTHVNGVLRAQFTRKRDTGDRKTDHAFTDTNCYKFLFPVSGGRLEPNGEMSKHINTPQVSENSICIQSCTAPQAVQSTSTCETEFRYPAGCEGAACDYVAKWEYSSARKDVKFEISSKELGRWTGIGFSRDGQMANSDMYTGWVYEGKAYVTDRFAYGRQLPAVDPADRQDIYEISGRADDDIQTISFRRKVLPADTITDFPLNKCYYFLFPIGGGRVLARKGQDFQNAKTPIGYHDLYQPKVSRTKICICDQNGVSIAGEDGAPAVRSRRQANRKDAATRLKRQLQDPFEVQVDPFSGTNKEFSESELDFPIEEKILKLEDVTVPAHVPLQVTQLATAAEIASTTASTVQQSSTSLSVQESTSGAFTPGAGSLNASSAVETPQLEPEPSSVPEPKPEITAPKVPVPEPEPEPEPEPSKASATPEPEPEPEPTISQRKEQKNREPEHPMDCVDMVIGSVVNGASKVSDYYSFSRATPQLDEFFGGRDSLTSATAYEKDGITTVIFRKPLEASDKADRAISREATTFVWAKGVKPSTYKPMAGESVFQDNAERTATFFPDDVLKYHGRNNRGHLVINFFGDDQQPKWPAKPSHKSECSGSFSYPSNCTHDKCTYAVRWWTDGKKISFTLSAAIPIDHWTGIGFSLDGSMAQSDVIVISVQDPATVKVVDMFSPGYSRPKADSDQGLFDIRTLYDQGRVHANFSRFLVSSDDNDISIDQCVYFLYPVSGGKLDAETKEIRKHAETPIPSGKKICPVSCAHISTAKKIPQNEPLLKASVLPEESIVTQSVAYDVILRILNREWNPILANRNTKEFHQMAAEVINAINSLVKTKFPQMRVIEIKKFSKGSVVVFLTLLSEDTNPPTEREVKEYLNEQFTSHHSQEALHLEATSVALRKAEKELSMKADRIRNWIVLGIGVTLFVIATFLVCCIVSRSRKVRAAHYSNYHPHYPMNGYGYNANLAGSPLENKKGGFDNAAYQATHSRQFSQATTASQNGTSKGSPNILEESPKGVGETTYQEWFSKVASKPGAQVHEETSLPSPSVRHPTSRQSISGGPPYMPYAQDAGSFYGEARIAPPGYYRPY